MGQYYPDVAEEPPPAVAAGLPVATPVAAPTGIPIATPVAEAGAVQMGGPVPAAIGGGGGARNVIHLGCQTLDA